jgi:hypothetical protein
MRAWRRAKQRERERQQRAKAEARAVRKESGCARTSTSKRQHRGGDCAAATTGSTTDCKHGLHARVRPALPLPSSPRPPIAVCVGSVVGVCAAPMGAVDMVAVCGGAAGSAVSLCVAGDGGVRRSTTLMQRALLNPRAGAMADYLRRDGDDRSAAPLRARLRLCCTGLAEHRLLRHQPADGHERPRQRDERPPVPAVLARDGCRLCRAAPETAEHLLLQCTARVALTATRAAARATLHAHGVPLNMAAFARLSPAGCDLTAIILRATARVLLAARTLLRW